MLKDKNRKIQVDGGFTLIEVLLSLAMIAILTGATLQIVRFSDTQKSLIIESDRFRATVREAQSNALAIPNENVEHICGFGVYVADDGFSFKSFYTYSDNWTVPKDACVSCMEYAASSPDCNVIEKGTSKVLPEGINFTSGKNNDIFFLVPYGDVMQAGGGVPSGGVDFTLTSNGRDIAVEINEFGKVE